MSPCTAPSAADLGELDDVSLVTRCGKEFLHFTSDAAPSVTLFVQHFNEETCEEIKVGERRSQFELTSGVFEREKLEEYSEFLQVMRYAEGHYRKVVSSSR